MKRQAGAQRSASPSADRKRGIKRLLPGPLTCVSLTTARADGRYGELLDSLITWTPLAGGQGSGGRTQHAFWVAQLEIATPQASSAGRTASARRSAKCSHGWHYRRVGSVQVLWREQLGEGTALRSAGQIGVLGLKPSADGAALRRNAMSLEAAVRYAVQLMASSFAVNLWIS